MVLEDDLVTAITLCKALHVGIPDALVLSAHSLAEARLMVKEYSVNFFILDINLPDGSGIDFIFDVTVANPAATIVLMTATPLPEYREQAAAFGVMHFMAKPLDCRSLVALVQASRTLPAPVVEEEDSLFGASLSRLTALDIIQLKCLNNTTQAILFKSTKHGSGRIYFQNGDIIHAETARSTGMTALSEIIGWKGGRAEELPESSPPERTITGSWQSTLLIAAHAADDKRPM
jgi:DNA-binding NarL/FixJ family response regulator